MMSLGSYGNPMLSKDDATEMGMYLEYQVFVTKFKVSEEVSFEDEKLTIKDRSNNPEHDNKRNRGVEF